MKLLRIVLLAHVTCALSSPAGTTRIRKKSAFLWLVCHLRTRVAPGVGGDDEHAIATDILTPYQLVKSACADRAGQ
jgi:hypothetical protein